MTLFELRNIFHKEITAPYPNDWEVDEVLESMLPLTDDEKRALISFVPVIWPVSNSLCMSYLLYGSKHIGVLTEKYLAEWVRQLLYWYEKDGLRRSREFMAEVEANFLASFQGVAGSRLEDVRARLVPFIHGFSEKPLGISTAPVSWTDGETIYLPESITVFPDTDDNFQLYLFLACCQWGFLRLGSLTTVIDADFAASRLQIEVEDRRELPVEEYFNSYPRPDLAQSIFHLLEFARVYAMIAAELPGMARTVQPLLVQLLRGDDGSQGVDSLLSATLQAIVTGEVSDGLVAAILTPRPASMRESLVRLHQLYPDCENAQGETGWSIDERILGRLDFSRVRECLERAREKRKTALVEQLARVINNHTGERENEQGFINPGAKEDGSMQVVISEGKNSNDGSEKSFALHINNEGVDIPAELNGLIAEITADFGHVPQGYMQAAAGVAGQAVVSSSTGPDAAGALTLKKQAVLYDEWDFRRKGYRKNWCALYQKELRPVHSHFVNSTLERYRAVSIRLRRQFEMLRLQQRFVRRRRYGDDLDFDALVDAMGDRVAGLAPSDRVFIRLLRDERDIAVLFLVDMSNSTEGWVGKAIKEALVLLSDVLEIVGDNYGIYGFSGMRRSRCDLYTVKNMEEPYSAQVRQRIAAISPREYTRMAPPIRHLTQKLMQTDAKVKLLIALTDGKPEDYDDYNGEYAVEDTSKALLEARGKGVLPFCITVDKEAHSYLEHMYGRGNYIHVTEVAKLPARLPEIYRLLTS